MITTCSHCQAKYQLDGDRVPARVIRVRCPACSGVFALDGTRRPAATSPAAPAGLQTGFDLNRPAAEAFAPPPPAPAQAAPAPAPEPLLRTTPAFDLGPVTPTAAPRPTPAPAAASTRPVAAPAAQVAVEEAPAPGTGRRRRSKEEMLARALVSDILVYNRELRDTALAEGNLLEALGGEIKKSWELYKEKVTPAVANSNNYFREALNDILAEGQKIF